MYEFVDVVVKNGPGRKRNEQGPAGRGRRLAVVDLLLIGLYVAVAAAIVVGLILFMLWGAMRD